MLGIGNEQGKEVSTWKFYAEHRLFWIVFLHRTSMWLMNDIFCQSLSLKFARLDSCYNLPFSQITKLSGAFVFEVTMQDYLITLTILWHSKSSSSTSHPNLNKWDPLCFTVLSSANRVKHTVVGHLCLSFVDKITSEAQRNSGSLMHNSYYYAFHRPRNHAFR